MSRNLRIPAGARAQVSFSSSLIGASLPSLHSLNAFPTLSTTTDFPQNIKLLDNSSQPVSATARKASRGSLSRTERTRHNSLSTDDPFARPVADHHTLILSRTQSAVSSNKQPSAMDTSSMQSSPSHRSPPPAPASQGKKPPADDPHWRTTCKTCGGSFRSRNQLMRHLYRAHPGPGKPVASAKAVTKPSQPRWVTPRTAQPAAVAKVPVPAAAETPPPVRKPERTGAGVHPYALLSEGEKVRFVGFVLGVLFIVGVRLREEEVKQQMAGNAQGQEADGELPPGQGQEEGWEVYQDVEQQRQSSAFDTPAPEPETHASNTAPMLQIGNFQLESREETQDGTPRYDGGGRERAQAQTKDLRAPRRNSHSEHSPSSPNADTSVATNTSTASTPQNGELHATSLGRIYQGEVVDDSDGEDSDDEGGAAIFCQGCKLHECVSELGCGEDEQGLRLGSENLHQSANAAGGTPHVMATPGAFREEGFIEVKGLG
ncbi:hypothetical protein VTI74DRAFT_10664 [Chaetomium olivicolor]